MSKVRQFQCYLTYTHDCEPPYPHLPLQAANLCVHRSARPHLQSEQSHGLQVICAPVLQSAAAFPRMTLPAVGAMALAAPLLWAVVVFVASPSAGLTAVMRSADLLACVACVVTPFLLLLLCAATSGAGKACVALFAACAPAGGSTGVLAGGGSMSVSFIFVLCAAASASAVRGCTRIVLNAPAHVVPLTWKLCCSARCFLLPIAELQIRLCWQRCSWQRIQPEG